MAEKKLCSCGCGKQAIKKGLAWGCYTKKHGEPPYGHKTASKKEKQAGRQKKASRKGPSRTAATYKHSDCPGCQALQLQVDDLTRAEKIMVAADLATPEQFEKARKIVRELARA